MKSLMNLSGFFIMLEIVFGTVINFETISNYKLFLPSDRLILINAVIKLLNKFSRKIIQSKMKSSV